MFLAIIHRDVAAAAPALAASGGRGVAWRTCLREVLFLDPGIPGGGATGTGTLSGAEAYAFLLETICGLRSPMLGETQVLGQFRAFLAALAPDDAARLDGVGQQLMTDARLIRERHLRGLGSRCYGSAVRRHVNGAPTVALIGTGALAHELRPYLSVSRRVEQWTRQDVALAGSRPSSDGPAVLVIAAPLRAAEIEAVARCYASLVRIIDLRDAQERDGFSLAAPVITLDDLFAGVAAASEAAAHRADNARREIQRMAAAFERRHQLRPFGWDDLCA